MGGFSRTDPIDRSVTEPHSFTAHPHRTFIRLSLPVLFSLVAEPITGLIDTAFVARLGSPALAGLGVATSLLAGVFWVFNFLSIGTQTEVARATGENNHASIGAAAGTAVTLAAAFGLLLLLAFYPHAGNLTSLFGATGTARDAAATYLRIRLLGGPAVLVSHALFGAFRGLQDMRTPLYIAVGANLLNIALDALLIHGSGPIPAFGIAGAAWASTLSQMIATSACLVLFHRRHQLSLPTALAQTRPLFTIGRDLFVRTGMLLLFLMHTTRVANLISVEAGAAHQAIRQVWIFCAFLLDAYATTAQSLVGYFIGSGDHSSARQVANFACLWGLGTGAATTLVMLTFADAIGTALLASPTTFLFHDAWWIAAVAQPVNAISFITDGIHWGSGDYRFLRNAMLVASGLGMVALAVLERSARAELDQVWIVVAAWISTRAVFGLGRIWPIASGPLARRPT